MEQRAFFVPMTITPFFVPMTITPLQPVGGKWKTLNRGPHATTSGFAFDAQGRFPILYRSDKVRSAKNCWSIPSGLHEEGLTLAQQFSIELTEELGLTTLPEYGVPTYGVYENIACVDDYHWVIAVLGIAVKDLGALVNKEPEKHSEIRIVSAVDFRPETLKWSPGLGEYLAENWEEIRGRILYHASLIGSGIILT